MMRARRSGVPGFGGWMRTLWQQLIDGQMWRGVASAAIATVLGLVVLPTVAGLVASVGLAFAPLGAADTVRVSAGCPETAALGAVFGTVSLERA